MIEAEVSSHEDADTGEPLTEMVIAIILQVLNEFFETGLKPNPLWVVLLTVP